MRATCTHGLASNALSSALQLQCSRRSSETSWWQAEQTPASSLTRCYKAGSALQELTSEPGAVCSLHRGCLRSSRAAPAWFGRENLSGSEQGAHTPLVQCPFHTLFLADAQWNDL